MSASTADTERLPHRLERQSSPGAQAGCSLAIGLLLCGVAAALGIYARPGADEGISWVLVAVTVLVGGLGMLLLYAGVHAWLATKTPETIVEMSEPRLSRGTEVRFLFRQPGPVSLISLRANLVGEETWVETRSVSGSHETTSKSRYLGTFNFFDSGPQEIGDVEPFEAMVTFAVPAEIPASGSTQAGHVVRWTIEVWGKVRHRADFMHPFAVEVA